MNPTQPQHASVNYSAGNGAIAAPKELGILQRADGLRSGIQNLRSRIEAFSDRLDGNGRESVGETAPQAISLSGIFSDTENDLRICLQMIDSLNSRF